MGMRREELSTADLAGQPPESAEPSDVTEEEADLARDDRTDAADRTEQRTAPTPPTAPTATLPVTTSQMKNLPVTTSQVNRP